MRKLLLIGLASVIGAAAAHSAEVAVVNPQRHAGGFAQQANNRVFAASTQPLPLPRKTHSASDARIAALAQQLFDQHATQSLLLLDRGEIVFEQYRAPAHAQAKMYSQSMSKSLTAYTLGAMLCDGKLRSLDDPAHRYVPELTGTAPGDAPLKHVLAMSSGGTDAKMAGAHEDNEWAKINRHQLTTTEVVKKHGAKSIASGQELRYSATDTFALSLTADAAGGFFRNFEQHLWQPARTESTGHWLFDREGKPMSASGFSATTRDWGRLALHSVRLLKSGGCMGDFMQAATHAQVPNKTKRVGAAFASYGYQTWVGNFGRVPSYWWLGYGGQRVGIDPTGEKILVLTSHREDYMGEVYRLFAQWTRP